MARGGQRETSPDGFCYVFPVAAAATANVRRCRFAHQNIPARRQHRSNVRAPLHNRPPERGFYAAAVAALNVPHTPAATINRIARARRLEFSGRSAEATG